MCHVPIAVCGHFENFMEFGRPTVFMLEQMKFANGREGLKTFFAQTASAARRVWVDLPASHECRRSSRA
jgi:hypothetical protein